MDPSNPKRAPDAPTEILDCIKRADNKLPPIPEMTYSRPILTILKEKKKKKGKKRE